MFKGIENLMARLLPKINKDIEDRAESTKQEIEQSKKVREQADNAVFAAYRKAGLAVSPETTHRRWED